MPRVELNDITIHYQQSGAGEDVVLIHGFTSNLAMWMFSKIVTTLSAEYRVTCIDLRGHGLSDCPAHGYTSAHMAEDFKELHEKLELRPAFLVGHSFGGVVAMHTARLYPEIVKGVILSDAYFPGLSHLEPNMEYAEVWQNLRSAMLKAGADIGRRIDFRRLFDRFAALKQDQLETLAEELGPPAMRWLEQMKPLTKTTAAEEFFEVAGLTADEITRVQQPVVALYDEHSPFSATCQFLAENLPDVQTDRIPGASHLAMLENPDEFVKRVVSNLRRLTTRQRVSESDSCSAASVDSPARGQS